MTAAEQSALLAQLTPHIRAVGDFIRQERAQFDRATVELKGPNDLVSYVDRTAEQQLVAACKALLPESGFITEEAPADGPERDFVWIIDPLDGTTNFVFGVPVFSISLALQHRGETVLGVVYELNQDEFFHALRGGGAFCNGRPIQPNSTSTLEAALLATGFPFREYGYIDEYLALLKDIFKSSRGLRRLGSAAVDLAYVACGRFDGYFETGLKPWDAAAGALLVEEAGGKVTDYSGGGDYLFGATLVATNGAVHAPLMALLQRHNPRP